MTGRHVALAPGPIARYRTIARDRSVSGHGTGVAVVGRGEVLLGRRATVLLSRAR